MKHYFVCRHTDSTVSEEAGIEQPTVANAGEAFNCHREKKNKREGRELAINAVLADGGTNSNDEEKWSFFTMLVLCSSYMKKPLVGGKEAVAVVPTTTRPKWFGATD